MTVLDRGRRVYVVNPEDFPGGSGATGGLTDAELRAASIAIFISGEVSKDTFTVTAIGDTVLLTPPVGQFIRLYKFAYSSDGGNSGGTVVTLKQGTASLDKQWLDPRQPYADSLTDRYIDFAVDQTLSVNLSLAVTIGIYVNLAYEFLT